MVTLRGEPVAVALPPRDFPLISGCEEDAAKGDDAATSPRPAAFLPTKDFRAARVGFLSDGGCRSTGTELTREDLRRPSWMKEVGPSTPGFFQGGDAARELDRREAAESASFRLFDGGPSGGLGADSSSLGTEGFESRVARSRGLSGVARTDGVGSGSGVTRAFWCKRPSELPFCMSRNGGGRGPLFSRPQFSQRGHGRNGENWHQSVAVTESRCHPKFGIVIGTVARRGTENAGGWADSVERWFFPFPA